MVPCRSAGRNYRKGRHKTMSDSEQPSTASQAVNEPSATTPPMFTSKAAIPPNIKLKGDNILLAIFTSNILLATATLWL